MTAVRCPAAEIEVVLFEGAGVPQADISEWESTSGSLKGDVKSKGSDPPIPVVSQAIRKGRVVYMEDIAYRT